MLLQMVLHRLQVEFLRPYQALYLINCAQDALAKSDGQQCGRICLDLHLVGKLGSVGQKPNCHTSFTG